MHRHWLIRPIFMLQALRTIQADVDPGWQVLLSLGASGGLAPNSHHHELADRRLSSLTLAVKDCLVDLVGYSAAQAWLQESG